jgi:hypothetical protein
MRRSLLILLLGMCPVLLYGHSGRTDSQGGHHNRSTGDYHFHHGMGPHQHPGGVCPYRSGASTYGQSYEKKNFFQKHPFLTIVGGLLAGGWAWGAYNDWKSKKPRP